MKTESKNKTVAPAEKKKGGRKRLEPWQKRSEKIYVKLSPGEKALLESKADECGIPVATLAYRAVMRLKIVPRITDEERRDLRDITGMANNVNQLAHTGNVGVSVKPQMTQFLRWVGSIISKYKL